MIKKKTLANMHQRFSLLYNVRITQNVSNWQNCILLPSIHTLLG